MEGAWEAPGSAKELSLSPLSLSLFSPSPSLPSPSLCVARVCVRVWGLDRDAPRRVEQPLALDHPVRQAEVSPARQPLQQAHLGAGDGVQVRW